MKKSKEGHTHTSSKLGKQRKKEKLKKKKTLPILTYVKLAYMNKALL